MKQNKQKNYFKFVPQTPTCQIYQGVHILPLETLYQIAQGVYLASKSQEENSLIYKWSSCTSQCPQGVAVGKVADAVWCMNFLCWEDDVPGFAQATALLLA